MNQQEVLDRVRNLSGRAELEARLTLASLVTSLLAEVDQRPVVVGGTAVDLYVSGGLGTSESYPPGWRESLDIDTIVLHADGVGSLSRARERLEAAGFEASSTGGSFLVDDVPYPIDVVGDELPIDYSRDHLQPVRYDAWDRFDLPRIWLVGPEDLLFDYMESGVDTRHQRDWTRALAIASAMGEHLDLGYLFTKAHWRRDGDYVEPLERVLAGEPLRIEEP